MLWLYKDTELTQILSSELPLAIEYLYILALTVSSGLTWVACALFPGKQRRTLFLSQSPYLWSWIRGDLPVSHTLFTAMLVGGGVLWLKWCVGMSTGLNLVASGSCFMSGIALFNATRKSYLEGRSHVCLILLITCLWLESATIYLQLLFTPVKFG